MWLPLRNPNLRMGIGQQSREIDGDEDRTLKPYMHACVMRIWEHKVARNPTYAVQAENKVWHFHGNGYGGHAEKGPH